MRRKLIGAAVSAALLAILYMTIDVGRLLAAFAAGDPAWLAAGLLMTAPMTLMQGLRLGWLVPRAHRPGPWLATRLVLFASSLNLVLPSKMGDVAKSWAMARRCGLPFARTLSVSLIEKALDMLGLLAWCALGLALSPALIPAFWAFAAPVGILLALTVALLCSARLADLVLGAARRLAPAGLAGRLARLQAEWTGTVARFWRRPATAALLIGFSIAVWLVNLLQIWVFVRALGAAVPFTANLALAPLALLAGLLPFTFAGIGTRDAALVALYAPFMAAPAGAALGLLCLARYLLPGLVGLVTSGGLDRTAAPGESSRVEAAPPGSL